MNIAHSGFISSSGARGWYETVEDDEVIEFKRPTNSLTIEAPEDTPLAIRINNLEDIWYIGGGSQEGIDGLRIYSITVLESAGTKIRWKALTY